MPFFFFSFPFSDSLITTWNQVTKETMNEWMNEWKWETWTRKAESKGVTGANLSVYLSIHLSCELQLTKWQTNYLTKQLMNVCVVKWRKRETRTSRTRSKGVTEANISRTVFFFFFILFLKLANKLTRQWMTDRMKKNEIHEPGDINLKGWLRQIYLPTYLFILSSTYNQLTD